MKRYLAEMALALAVYAIMLAISLRLLAHGLEDQATRVAVSLLPMIPAAFLCWVVLRQFRRLDEMQRKLQFEALVLSFAGTALVTVGYGFLENAGFPRLSMFAVLPLMCAFWMVGLAVGRLRYR